MIAAAAVLLAAAAVALAFQGPPAFTGMRIAVPNADLGPRSGADEVTGTPAPREQFHETRIDLTWLVFALTVIAAIVVAALIWRSLRRRLHRPEPAAPVALAGTTDGLVPPEPGELPRPERVRRGLERALDLLGDGREPRDAIERAWLGLEEGAADSGVRRMLAETPGEFVARAVTRVSADRGAADRLLDLYLRARFSDAPVTGADVVAAREAIEVLRASWSGAATGAATGGAPR